MILHPSFIPGLLVATSVFFGLLCLARLRQRRLLAAGRAGISAGVAGALALAVMAVAANLYTYQRLSYERPLAELQFQRLGSQHFQVVLSRPGRPNQKARLSGDEWRIEARVLKWRPAANLLGFDALARLERLSGRYRDIAQANHKPHRAIALQTAADGWDAWRAAHHLPRGLAPVDARYGSATYLPMADNARYRVTLSQNGLVARPINAAARRATRRWWD